MAYKIAVASSDGKNVDLTFGAALEFVIYNVDGINFNVAENRKFVLPENAEPEINSDCFNENGESSCKNGKGCGNGGGCSYDSFPKVQLISDCRCVVCKKIGFNVQKQLEKLAITSFDVNCSIEEALYKIVVYLQKIDNHQSLRGIANNNK